MFVITKNSGYCTSPFLTFRRWRICDGKMEHHGCSSQCTQCALWCICCHSYQVAYWWCNHLDDMAGSQQCQIQQCQIRTASTAHQWTVGAAHWWICTGEYSIKLLTQGAWVNIECEYRGWLAAISTWQLSIWAAKREIECTHANATPAALASRRLQRCLTDFDEVDLKSSGEGTSRKTILGSHTYFNVLSHSY